MIFFSMKCAKLPLYACIKPYCPIAFLGGRKQRPAQKNNDYYFIFHV